MDAAFQLTPVAFLRSTGGRVRILLAVDREGVQLFDGEPVLLVEHRPGGPLEDVAMEGAERIAADSIELVLARTAQLLAALVEDAHDEFGQLDGERLLGRAVDVVAPASCFDE